jgi:hypothetical protein
MPQQVISDFEFSDAFEDYNPTIEADLGQHADGE